MAHFLTTIFGSIYHDRKQGVQVDLDAYMEKYNAMRTHQGKRCLGRTPMDTFLDGKKYFEEKNLEAKLAA